MKALSLWQPWASLIALGHKRIETRSWSTSYRGPLAIHATSTVGISLIRGASFPLGDFTIENDTPRGSRPQYLLRGPIAWPYRLPLGSIVAVCDLVDVVPMLPYDDGKTQPCILFNRRAPYPEAVLFRDLMETGEDISAQTPYGDFAPGRFAWMLDNVRPINPPIPTTGHQGLWNWDTSALAVAEGITA